MKILYGEGGLNEKGFVRIEEENTTLGLGPKFKLLICKVCFCNAHIQLSFFKNIFVFLHVQFKMLGVFLCLAGLRKEDLNIQIMEENVLQIVGVHTGSVGGEGYTHISERPRGTFLRQYRLPDTALLDKVQAFDQDGILTITIPKLKPRVRTIPIFVSKL